MTPDTRKLTGTKGAYLQPLRYGRNESGIYSLYVWEGTAAAVLSNVPVVEANGGFWEYQESFSGGKCRLEARIPTNPAQAEQPINTWEFFASVVEKDILEADISIVNSISQINRRILQYHILNPQESGATTFNGDGSETAAANLLKLIDQGVRSVRVNAPTLRNTTTCSTKYQVKATLQNVGKLFTPAQLSSLDGVPGNTLFILPSDTSTKTGYTYKWYKKHPTVRSAANAKIQIEREWEYGLWPDGLYTDAS